AIAGEGLTSFVHAHPIADRTSPIRENEAHTHTAEALGPAPASIQVVTSFPAAGLYKLWVQFRVAGQGENGGIPARAGAGWRKWRREIAVEGGKFGGMGFKSGLRPAASSRRGSRSRRASE